MRNPLFAISRLPRKALCAVITVYQKTLSPDHGPMKHLYPYGYCRHEPTCSQYAKRVIHTRGAIIGCCWALWRIVRCNPFAKPSDEKLQKVIERTSQTPKE